jgi:uncharacterized protein YbjT (DUF2867 family)
MLKKTAVIVGATGSIGRELVPLVTSSPHYENLVVFHYRPTPLAGRPKIEERIVDFAKLASVSALGAATVFCCIGTTQKKAGSTEAFQKVDRDIPVALAKWAAAGGIATFVTISSIGADAHSKSVYLRTKGEMEEGVARAGVPLTYILRPCLLDGKREEFRLAEEVGNRALRLINPLMIGPLRRYRSVRTQTVAAAMLACGERGEPGVHIIESEVIQDLGS